MNVAFYTLHTSNVFIRNVRATTALYEIIDHKNGRNFFFTTPNTISVDSLGFIFRNGKNHDEHYYIVTIKSFCDPIVVINIFNDPIVEKK